MQSIEQMEMVRRRCNFLDIMENHLASKAPIEPVPISESIASTEWFRDCGLDKIFKPHAVMAFKFPGFSGKVVGMFNILLKLQELGVLNPDITLVAPTSGNLGGAGGLLAGRRARRKLFEVKDVLAIVDSTTSEGKKSHLRMSGATVVVAPEGTTAIDHAKQLSQQPDHYFLDQYTLIENVLAQRWLAQAIYGALGSKVSSFVCAVGSMASFVGARRFLPPLVGEHVKIIGVASMPEDDQRVPGSRPKKKIVGTGFDYQDHPSYRDYPLIEDVSKREAAIATDEYVRAEISAGFTSGLASAGHSKLLEKKAKDGRLQDLMNEEGYIVPVFLFMDMYLPYATELASIIYGS